MEATPFSLEECGSQLRELIPAAFISKHCRRRVACPRHLLGACSGCRFLGIVGLSTRCVRPRPRFSGFIFMFFDAGCGILFLLSCRIVSPASQCFLTGFDSSVCLLYLRCALLLGIKCQTMMKSETRPAACSLTVLDTSFFQFDFSNCSRSELD